eukprot:7479430-Pyramimonas_sp.AAC.1
MNREASSYVNFNARRRLDKSGGQEIAPVKLAAVVSSTVRASIPPGRPQRVLQNACVGDCNECLVLAGASSLRPR